MTVRRLASILAAALVLGLPAAPAMAQPPDDPTLNRCLGQKVKDAGGASHLAEGELAAYIDDCQAQRHLRF